MIHIIRHGQSLHNVQRGYPYRDPPLTQTGIDAAGDIKIPTTPDLIVISPMTRTIQTALTAFPSIADADSVRPEVQIWPELREAHDAICNKGVSRTEMAAKFPHFDFTDCPEDWDFQPHNVESATVRAENVRQRLQTLSETYSNIAVITHRGFIAYLVQGVRFDVGETRSYVFKPKERTHIESDRFGINIDTNDPQDFGPTVLIPVEAGNPVDNGDANSTKPRQ